MTARWLTRVALSSLLAADVSLVYAETLPKISPLKRTGKVKLVTQNIGFARHEKATVTAATILTWTRDGSRALQVKDSPSDVACPVKLQRSGDIPAFKNFGDFTFEIIDTPEEYDALQGHVAQLAKVVREITWCAEDGTFDGCTRPGHIVVVASPTNPLTLVHEFGHHKALDGDPDPKRLMNDDDPGNEVTTLQCDAFKK